MDAATNTPSLVELEQEALTVKNEMAAISIVDQESYNDAVLKRTQADKWLRNARDFFKGMKDPAYAAWKKICANENLVCDPVEAVKKQLNRALLDWDYEQQQKQRQAQLELEAEARRKAENERIAQAEQMKAEGATEETIDAVLDTPVQVTEIAVAAPTYEASKAVIYKDNWGGVCDDLFKLVQAVAKDKSKIGLLMVNQPALNQMAKALKESMSIPGCRPVNNRIAATGRG